MMNGTKLGGRELRVQVCGKRFKGNGQKKDEEDKAKAKSTDKGAEDKAVTLDFQGKTASGAQRRVAGKTGGKGGKGKGGGKGGKGKGGGKGGKGGGKGGKGEGKGGKGKGKGGKGGKGKGKGSK
jgi:hypothetical protein